MTEPEQKCVEKIRKHYDTIHDKFDDLLNKCGDDKACKRQIGDSLQDALESYIEVQNKILGSSAGAITTLNKASDDAQEDIENALESLENFKKALNTITKAVKTVGTIVATL